LAIPARRAATMTPSHEAIATQTPPLSCTTARSSRMVAHAMARASHTHVFTSPFQTTTAATPSVAITSSTNAVPAIAPAASQATVAASAPTSPPRSAAATVFAARWRRVSAGEVGATTLMSPPKVPRRSKGSPALPGSARTPR
jgi:hypothetical protein